MSATDIAFFLFPIGIGETDVAVHGEVSVLLSATADTTPPHPATSTAHAQQQQQQQQPSLSRPSTPPPQLPSPVLPTPSPGERHVAFGPASPGSVHQMPLSVLRAISSSCPSSSSSSTGAPQQQTQQQMELACRMHYMGASYLCATQRGKPLARCVASSKRRHAPLVAPAGGCVELEKGQRAFYVCPVEDGRYLSAVVLPASTWRILGGGDGTALVHWLLHTSLTGYVVPLQSLRNGNSTSSSSSSNRTSNSKPAAYATVHARLLASAHAVQQSMAARVGLLAQITQRCQSQPHLFAQRAVALRRLCREEASPLRTHPRLWRRVEELLHSAVCAASPASLRGGLPTMGLEDGACRYVCVASSLWHRGHPLYTSVPLQDQEGPVAHSVDGKAARLRSAALSVVFEELKHATAAAGSPDDVAYTGAASATLSITAQCICTSATVPAAASSSAGSANGGGHGSAKAVGYTRHLMWSATSENGSAWHADPSGASAAPSTAAAAPCGVSLALTTSSGWTVAVLLQPMSTPSAAYLGAPLSTIFAGVQHLMETTVESDAFLHLVRDATAAMRSSWQRPVCLLSPLAAQLEAAVKTIRVGRRLPTAASPARSRDAVLYYLDTAAAAAAELTAFSSSASPVSFPASALSCCTSDAAKLEKRRTAELIDAYAEAQRCRSLGEGDASDPQAGGRQTLSAAVGAIVQVAMRYAEMSARLFKSCAGHARRQPRCAAPTLTLRRTQTVFSVLTEADAVRVVCAVPYCSSSSITATAAAAWAVVYAVVELDKRKMPACAQDEYRAFTNWILSKCS